MKTVKIKGRTQREIADECCQRSGLHYNQYAHAIELESDKLEDLALCLEHADRHFQRIGARAKAKAAANVREIVVSYRTVLSV